MTQRRPTPDEPTRAAPHPLDDAGTKRRLALVVGMGLVGVTLIALFLLTPGAPADPTDSSFALPSAAVTRPPLTGALAPLKGAVTVVDGPFEQGTERSIRNATAHKNQSKLWFA